MKDMANLNIKEDKELLPLNHSCAHLLAQAVKRLYPNTKFWVGPVITNGFYYDMDMGDVTLTESDFAKLEEEMKKISKEKLPIERKEISKKEAIELFKEDPYKEDLINNLEDGHITIYSQGDFTDLCRAPHISNTKELKYFKLTKVSGAYFKGDSKNKMLQRVYGICFNTKEDLKNYLDFIEEAKNRDHRRLGKDLELFTISEYGPGFPIYLPYGQIVYRELENFWYEEHFKHDYKFIQTPTMLNRKLWETSGHWDNYKENMYTTKIEDETYAIKPMNCPGSAIVFASKLRSYRDLPLRLGELGHVHRYEASGALSGLFRVRAFTQDDAHIFITKDQIEKEIEDIFVLIDKMYKVFNLDYKIELSTRPEKFLGKLEDWDNAEDKLLGVLNRLNKPYKINPGDGAFYGPKIDVQVIDSLGREWQCATIQLDYQIPIRFDLNYIDEKGEKERPIIIHRVIYGSFERMMGILIEHYNGAFPTWLAPVQVNILPINNEYHLEDALKLKEELKEKGVRVEVDDSDEKFNKRIRNSQVRKIPLTIIVGDNEIKNEEISYRVYGSKDTITIKKEAFLNYIVKLIKERD